MADPVIEHSKRFASTARRLRRANAMTQVQLSERMGAAGYDLSRGAIQRLEAGERTATVDDVFAYSHVFEIGLAQLLVGCDRFGVPFTGPLTPGTKIPSPL